ncbi:MAG: hypothetical protein KAJ10_06295, partial [Thermodesulfovibrionia bacterium]|nr:hypothetical protein [Thermodesulfovibrionia bacterium]
MRLIYAVIIVSLIVSFIPQKAAAISEQQRRINEEKTRKLQATELKTLKGEGRFTLDYEGWVNYR